MRNGWRRDTNCGALIGFAGLAGLVREQGFSNVRELDWYETDMVGQVKFQSTPAVHRSNRGIFDVNWPGLIGNTRHSNIGAKTGI